MVSQGIQSKLPVEDVSSIEPSSTESESNKTEIIHFEQNENTKPKIEDNFQNSLTEVKMPLVEPPKLTKQQARDDQLLSSQKLVPLQMRSSFLPSESHPRNGIEVKMAAIFFQFQNCMKNAQNLFSHFSVKVSFAECFI